MDRQTVDQETPDHQAARQTPSDPFQRDEHDENSAGDCAHARRCVGMEPIGQKDLSPPRTLDDLEEEHEESCEDDKAPVNSSHVQYPNAQHDYVNDQTNVDHGQQLNLLRDLLRIERAHNENHRANMDALKRYLQKLQMDYLRQQSDLIETLEFNRKLKAQKDSQIATIEATVREKDALIEQLRSNIANLDESTLRKQIETNLEKQKQLAQVEQDQLRHQIQTIEEQLAKEQASHSQMSQKLQQRLDEQQKVHEKELAAMCSRLKQTQGELDRLMSEPQHLIVRSLKEDKAALEGRLDEVNIVSQELQTKYANLKGRMEMLVAEQEHSEQRNQDEMDKLQQQQADQRASLNEVRLELEDKHEIIQILQFNLQRSEKRVKNLLGVMKNKEETYRGMVAQMELRHQQEVEQIRNEQRLAEKQLIENGGDLDRKQNELVRLRLEQESQLESMRNDRDERLNRMNLDKQNLERELKATELRLAREIEQASGKTRLIEKLFKEVNQFREESKRLSIELTKSEAKLYAKQQELNQSIQRSTVKRSASQNELEEATKVQQMTLELEEERRLSRKLNVNIGELKKENGKLNVKLRIAEANLDRMTTAINREHNKMVREYEKKLEQIRSEQVTFDKSKMRYKRYGYKLKRYCEHLRHVHEHLCNPTVCGYILEPVKSSVETNMTPSARGSEKRPDNCDKMSLLSNENDSEYDVSYLDEHLELASNQSNKYSTDDGYSTRKSYQKCPPAPVERFVVRRTGLSPVPKRTPSMRARKLSFKQPKVVGCPRVPLKSKEPNVLHHGDQTKLLNEHEYYYINEDHPHGDKMSQQDESMCRQAVI